MGKITENTLGLVRKRLREHIKRGWSEKFVDFEVRSRTNFIYVDVEFAESGAKFGENGLRPDAVDPDHEDFDDDDEPEGNENLQPFMRLRYMGRTTEWQLACYNWSGGRGHYEPVALMNGMLFGTPEECFDAAAFPWR